MINDFNVKWNSLIELSRQSFFLQVVIGHDKLMNFNSFEATSQMKSNNKGLRFAPEVNLLLRFTSTQNFKYI